MQQRTTEFDVKNEWLPPGGAMSSGTKHGFGEPDDLRLVTGGDPFLLELIETPAFRRLKQVRFLGAIDYRLVPRPNGKPGATRYTRYEHSIGVMQLAQLYCDVRDLQPTDRRLACVAALLHDLGHPPFSHSMESVFKEEFGIDHHEATTDIIHGRISSGRDVFEALRRHGMDIERLAAVISGEVTEFEGFFHGPINFDTVEGILRSCMYVRQSSTVPDRYAVTKAAVKRANEGDRRAVDQFWKCKGWVYENVINSREGVLSDFACKFFLRRNLGRVGRDSYYGTEAELFRKLPGLREFLTGHGSSDDVVRMLDEPVYYTSRHYHVNPEGDFFARQDDVRYQHSRSDRDLILEHGPGLTETETMNQWQGALFDEDDDGL